MKRRTLILVLCVTALVCVVFACKPAALWFAKAHLRAVFTDSNVSIGNCAIIPDRLIVFSGITVSRGSIYSLKIKEVRLSYDIFSLIRGAVKKASVIGAAVSLDLGQKSIARLNEYIHIKPGKSIAIKELELTDARIEIKAKEMRGAAEVSFLADLLNRTPEYLRVKIATLESQGMVLKELLLTIERAKPEGAFSVKELRYGKAKMEEITGRPGFKGETIFLNALTAKVLDGRIEGNVAVALTKTMEYTGTLECINLNLDTFVNDFDLKERLLLNGTLTGTVTFKGDSFALKGLSGELRAGVSGGTMNIKDAAFAQGLAKDQQQPLDIFVESLKNYHYNKGSLRVGLQEKNLLLGVALEGESGKRDLNIIVHDFNLAH